ncbi:hypothetical protein ABC628_08345 [Lentilactobacillus otakiensis]|uniref:Uncharacterized protein n=1 Tax=Lentilactobacillus otakiensis DSM 19908 = JCM 15040 TaxID=1423780 RepID=S4NUF3_9LACO|nr:hypothetical protein [Lentilactobacillus otakiensis]KRL09935.1 hypothetical protein FD05_GL000922 [Lentilactobacillus otakiensis DSM 19908 = JCM 15040]MBZ3776293.1 hypothetical protein [Lentilactobacillus otakiensis]MDV3517283.1 hypothetical protein [Lentilactobacillus otakiensis]GAD17588.1 hypothetical protein LOT_2126 [Lentilactobacillus otakiensis DSM 19908 = JCM 15040]
MKKTTVMTAVLTLLASVAIAPLSVSASSHSTIPKTLRGTWYRYNGKSFNTLKLTTHKFAYSGIGGSSSLTPSQKGYKRLYVQKKAGKYTFNRYTKDYQNPGSFKISKRKIGGHYRKALFQYTPTGYVIVLTKVKYHHDYSFQTH